MQDHTYPPPESLKKELAATVRRVIGPIATPDSIHVSDFCIFRQLSF